MTFVLPWLVPAWWRDLKSKNAAVLLLLGWVLLVLIFFSLSDGKRSLYIFPAAPALALVRGIPRQITSAAHRRAAGCRDIHCGSQRSAGRHRNVRPHAPTPSGTLDCGSPGNAESRFVAASRQFSDDRYGPGLSSPASSRRILGSNDNFLGWHEACWLRHHWMQHALVAVLLKESKAS